MYIHVDTFNTQCHWIHVVLVHANCASYASTLHQANTFTQSLPSLGGNCNTTNTNKDFASFEMQLVELSLPAAAQPQLH